MKKETEDRIESVKAFVKKHQFTVATVVIVGTGILLSKRGGSSKSKKQDFIALGLDKREIHQLLVDLNTGSYFKWNGSPKTNGREIRLYAQDQNHIV